MGSHLQAIRRRPSSWRLTLLESRRRYGMFDTLKQQHARLTGCEPGVMPALSYGVASAFMGQLASFPLETVSRRLQLQSGPLAGSSFGQMLRQVVREEGPAALYRCSRCSSLPRHMLRHVLVSCIPVLYCRAEFHRPHRM